MSEVQETTMDWVKSSPKRREAMVQPDIRRMTRADLVEMAAWLIGRLTERHAEATPAQIMAWLHGCMTSNEHWFVRSANVCALAQLVRLPLEPQPIAQDIFVFVRPDAEEAPVMLYSAMASWAAHLDASRLDVDIHTDVPRITIAAHFGSVQNRRIASLKLGRLG